METPKNRIPTLSWCEDACKRGNLLKFLCVAVAEDLSSVAPFWFLKFLKLACEAGNKDLVELMFIRAERLFTAAEKQSCLDVTSNAEILALVNNYPTNPDKIEYTRDCEWYERKRENAMMMLRVRSMADNILADLSEPMRCFENRLRAAITSAFQKDMKEYREYQASIKRPSGRFMYFEQLRPQDRNYATTDMSRIILDNVDLANLTATPEKDLPIIDNSDVHFEEVD